MGEHLAPATAGGAATTITPGGMTGTSTEATELFSDMITKIVISPTFPGDVIAGGRGDGWRPWVLLIGLFCLSRKKKQIRTPLLRPVFLEKKNPDMLTQKYQNTRTYVSISVAIAFYNSVKNGPNN